MPNDVLNYVLRNKLDDDVLVNMTSTANDVKDLSFAIEATSCHGLENENRKNVSKIGQLLKPLLKTFRFFIYILILTVDDLMTTIRTADHKNPDLLSGVS